MRDHDASHSPTFGFDEPDEGDRDNITDWCLDRFQARYGSHVTKDDIWEYLYGVMHAPDWRERYKHDLGKKFPRVPLAPDFESFRAAGAEMMAMHADWGSVPEHDGVRCLVDGRDDSGGSDGDAYRIVDKMRWLDKSAKTVLAVNDRCRCVGIPPEAHQYRVSGRSPLDWAVDQLQVKRYKVGKHDNLACITDDVNGWADWADDPFELIRHLRRLVWLSVRTAQIVDGLPASLGNDEQGGIEVAADAEQPQAAAA